MGVGVGGVGVGVGVAVFGVVASSPSSLSSLPSSPSPSPLTHHPQYTLCGTAQFMAPEMIAGRGHDVRVDWWALGVLLVDMALRRTPFAGKDAAEVMEHVARESIEPVRPALRGIGEDLDRVVGRLLVKDPNRRAVGDDAYLEVPEDKDEDEGGLLRRRRSSTSGGVRRRSWTLF